MKAHRSHSSHRFHQIAENAADWLWKVDAAGLYTYAGPAVEHILGYRPEEIVGHQHFYDLFTPADREALKQEFFAGFAHHETFRGHLNTNLHRDGHQVILETNAVPMVNAQGQLLGYRGAAADVTQRKCAEGTNETGF